MGVFNRLPGNFDTASGNGIWRCAWKLSLSLFPNVHIGGGLLQFPCVLLLETNKSNVVYDRS